MAINPNWAVTEVRNSPNYWSGRAGSVTNITIHHWGEDGQSHDNPVAWLCRPDGTSSAHYVVSSGRVTQLVSDMDTAWHAGSREGNATGIGIECRPECSEGDFYTVARLIAAIRSEWGDLPLVGHRDWSSTACPGRWYGRLRELSDLAYEIAASDTGGIRQVPEPSAPRERPPMPPGSGSQIEVDGDPGEKTYRRFQEVMGTTVDGVKSEPSEMVMAFQEFLNDAVGEGHIRNLGCSGAVDGALDVDGYDGPKTWKVFQFLAWCWHRDLVSYYAPGWDLWEWCDGDDGPRTWMVLQHILNMSDAGSGRLV